jgi:hypothetical protein
VQRAWERHRADYEVMEKDFAPAHRILLHSKRG